MSHIWQNAERELAALRARVAELEAFEVAAKERVAGLVTANAELSAWVTDLQGDARQLTAECERFKAQRDAAAARAGQRLAERDAALATLERVRAECAQHREHADCARRRRLAVDADDLDAFCEAVEDALGQAEPAPRTNLERVRGLIAGWRATDPCDPRGAELALRDAADELEDALTPPG